MNRIKQGSRRKACGAFAGFGVAPAEWTLQGGHVVDHDPTRLYQCRDGSYGPDLLIAAIVEIGSGPTWLGRSRAAERATSM